MKKLLLFLFACNAFHCIAQIQRLTEKRNDTSLNNHIKKMTLAENQYFNTENKNFIILFTIVPDRALKNKDSLFQDSKRAYKEILINLGKRMENENIDIAYWGKETDRNNVSFSYVHNHYNGEASYNYHSDTLLAPDSSVRQRLTKLSYNKYVRHRLDGNGLSIAFNVILNDASKMNQKMAEKDAVKFLIQYVGEQYCTYSSIKVFYIDQYSGAVSLFTAKVSDLILNNLANYLKGEKPKL
jgi:hypothetical protein